MSHEFWGVETTYHAGGRVDRNIHRVTAPSKPANKETEMNTRTVVEKYFDNYDDVLVYMKESQV